MYQFIALYNRINDTLPKNRSSVGKKCSGHTFSKYHSKLLHCSFSRNASLERICCLYLSLAASNEIRDIRIRSSMKFKI